MYIYIWENKKWPPNHQPVSQVLTTCLMTSPFWHSLSITRHQRSSQRGGGLCSIRSCFRRAIASIVAIVNLWEIAEWLVFSKGKYCHGRCFDHGNYGTTMGNMGGFLWEILGNHGKKQGNLHETNRKTLEWIGNSMVKVNVSPFERIGNRTHHGNWILY